MSDTAPKKAIYKRWWFWLVGGILVLSFLGSLNSPDPVDTANEATKAATTQQVVTQPPTTLDTLWQAVDSGLRTRKGIDVTFDEATGRVVLTDTPANPYMDATMTVRHGQADLIYFGQKAFAIEGVKTLTVVVLGNFTDKYGNQITEESVRLSMSKTEFVKYNWSNLVGLSIEQQLRDAAIEYYVHPAVLKEVNASKLHLESAP